MSYRNLLCYCLFIANLLVTSTIVAEEIYRLEKKINELIEPLVDAKILRGVAVGVVDRDSMWTRSYGTLAANNSQVPNENTIFEIGSISKVFTGILLASSVNSGEVTLDDSIGSILDSIAAKNPDVASSIRLRHLSTHSSGLPRLPGNWSPANEHFPYVDYDRTKMIEFLETAKPEKIPGEPSGYSNYAVGLLGELLSTKAGKTYQQILKERITEPLEMHSTSTHVSDTDRTRLAPPHQSNGEPDHEWEFDAFAGAGAIRSTVHDMQLFIQAHLDPRKDDLGKAIELAWEQHLPPKGDHCDGTWLAYCTRWQHSLAQRSNGRLSLDADDQSTFKIGVVVLCNTASSDVDWIGASIIQVLAGIEVKPQEISNVNVSQEVLARLEGEYELTPEFVLTVTAKSGQLFVQATKQPSLRVYPSSETTWFYREVDAKLTFALPETGAATTLTLHQNGRDMKAHKRK